MSQRGEGGEAMGRKQGQGERMQETWLRGWAGEPHCTRSVGIWSILGLRPWASAREGSLPRQRPSMALCNVGKGTNYFLNLQVGDGWEVGGRRVVGDWDLTDFFFTKRW